MLGLSAVALVLSAAAVDCFAPVCPFVRRQGGITWHDSAHPPCATRARRPVIAHMSASSAASELAEAAISKEAIATLQEQGFVVIENAITDELASRALQGCEMMQRNGKLQTLREQYAQGRQDAMMVLDVWQDAWGPIPTDFEGMNMACQFLKEAASAIVRHCQPPHKWSELCAPPYMQLAMYPKTGAKYVRHLDNDPLDEGNREGPVGLRVCDRVVTALLYFNKDWTPEDGGYLRLYRPEEGREEEVLLEVAPAAGTLVLFESERFFHEVLPSFRSRWALSAWITSISPGGGGGGGV